MSDKEDNANDQVAEELPPSNKLGDFLNESENPFSYHDRSNH